MLQPTPGLAEGIPKRRRRRTVTPAALVAVVIALAVLAVGVLVAGLFVFSIVTAPWNPVLLAFLASFEMYNDSGADIWVTPIGMREGSGEYGPLPMYQNKFPPAKRARSNHDIPLRDGDSLTITYDCDDINFRHILVRTQQRKLFIVDTDRIGNLDSCYPPQEEVYGIPPLADLAQASDELVPCTRGKTVRYSAAQEY